MVIESGALTWRLCWTDATFGDTLGLTSCVSEETVTVFVLTPDAKPGPTWATMVIVEVEAAAGRLP